MTLKAPFAYFGGKSRVADVVWDALGDVQHYVEPFAGSLAVLLARPEDHTGTIETVNDKDRYLANFWRAMTADSAAVAHHCDWPVNETDLFARHMWLVQHGSKVLERLDADPDFYDAKIAGWWVWGICNWIGGGWCTGKGPWSVVDGEVVKGGSGVWRQLPHMNAGRGVNRKRPHMGNAGQGVNRKLPHIDPRGRWVSRPGIESLVDYLGAIQQRIRHVRVCCGDWSRVVTEGVLSVNKGNRATGIFLDPPYLGEVRDKNIYAQDDHFIAAEVRNWAIANGTRPNTRIVLAGYEPEHVTQMAAAGWRMHAYSGGNSCGTARSSAAKDGNHERRHLERLWFSPQCIVPTESTQETLL